MSEHPLQTEIQRFGRLYVAISEVNRAVVRSRSRDELLREVTRVLVEVGGFGMTFVAWRDPATCQLIPAARFGEGQGYADLIRMSTDDSPEGQGPAGTAFREGVPYICNDFFNDPRTQPWREAAMAHGWRASAAFPIEIDGKKAGILSVYGREPGMFGADQVELLKQAVVDMAFGIQHLDGEEKRRQTEAALLASQHRLQMAIDAAGLGTFDRDLETGRAVWSGHHEQMFGLAPGSFDGRQETFDKFVHPEDLVRLRRAEQEACDSHTSFSQELRILWPDGSEHWVFGQGGFLYNGSGRPCRKYGVVLDITERKRVDAALRESEARLQQAVRVSDIGIFDHDHITNTIYASPRDREINGIGPEEAITLPRFIQRVHPEDRERIGAAVQASLDPSGDGFFDVENRLLMPDGTVRWTSTRAQTFFEGKGAARRPVRTVGAVREITAQKLAEDEQKKLSTLVAMNRDLIGIATLEGRGVYLNQAGLNLSGLTQAELPQKTILDFFPESHRRQAAEEMLPALFDAGYWRGESVIRRFNTGELIDVEITAFLIRDERGTPLYVATVTRDIRERKRNEAEKARLKEELFQAQKMESIGRLAGGVAHDFNNLLTVINGHSQLLLAKLSPVDPLRESIAEIHNAGKSAEALTRQLLAFGRKQVLEPRELDLNRVVGKLRPMLQRLAGDAVEMRVALASDGAYVRADPHQVEQVLMNLVMNARDAMPRGGRLLIETARVPLDDEAARRRAMPAGKYILLAVSDNGAGMGAETRERIFEPFFTTKPASRGTGLGLAIVQGIVAQSGGHVGVSSEPGLGTKFEIYLPAVEGAAPDDASPTLPALGGKETVLVVEDTPEVRHYAVEALKSYGYSILQAANAGEALLIFERAHETIHMVLTDVVMPNLSGRELAERLEKIRPGVKVLFMSGYNDDVITLDRTLAAPVHFIDKPFSPEALAAKVRAMLGPPVDPARILVVDDEAGVRRFLRQVLEGAGYEVEEAPDGKKAVDLVRSTRVDLMITDLIMPEQEGIETMQALRKEMPALAIIAISGAFEGSLLKAAQFLGADAALAKPVSPDALLSSVALALRTRRRPQAISSST